MTKNNAVEDALRLIHPDRLLCNCRQAYSPDGWTCPSGCSTNQMVANTEIALAYLSVVSPASLEG